MVSNADYEIMHKAYAEALSKILELEAELAEARLDGARLTAIIKWASAGDEWLQPHVWERAAELCPIKRDEADNTQKWVRAVIDEKMEAK